MSSILKDGEQLIKWTNDLMKEWITVLISPPDPELSHPSFEVNSIISVIRGLDTIKATGPDNIPVQLLKETHVWLNLLKSLTSHLDKGCQIDTVYLCMLKAFDRVSHQKLITKLCLMVSVSNVGR